MSLFLSGVISTLYWIAALFFFRFWAKVQDRLFGAFGLALFLLGLERLLFLFIPIEHQIRPYVYVVRLAAFVLILTAIVDKNLRPRT